MHNMSGFQNVVVAGATGAVGAPVLNALLSSGKFNVTVLSRESSTATFPSNVKVIRADFESVESLTNALKGQDAVVSTVGTPGLLGQTKLVDAAIAAGVKRFIPSDFGCDLDNPKTRQLPVFGYKVVVEEHLKQAVKTHPEFSYTLLRTGGFLDWGLKVGFLLKHQERKPLLFNGGDVTFSSTTLPTIGQAVATILSKPAETANKALRIEEIQTSQNQLLTLAKKVTSGQTWEPTVVSTEDLFKESLAKLQAGEVTHAVMVNFLFVAIHTPGYGPAFETNDNELLGVKPKTEADVEALLKQILA